MPTPTVCSHIIPFPYPQLFPEGTGGSAFNRALPLTQVVCSLNSFVARLRCMAKKQSCPNGMALACWKSSGTCLPGCRGSQEIPISYLNGGSKHSLACSASLNYPNPSGEENNVEGGAPIVPAQLCAARSELIILNSCLFLT